MIRRRTDGFLRIFDLQDDVDAPMSAYSKGMRQKILISAALLHDPAVVVLDEPNSGLDVTTTLVLRSLVQALAAEGRIVVYSSHVLESVEQVATDVLILHDGRVVAHDSVVRLRELMHALVARERVPDAGHRDRHRSRRPRPRRTSCAPDRQPVRQVRLLARTFFVRLFESDLMPPGLPQVQLVIWSVVLVATPTLTLPGCYAQQVHRPVVPPGHARAGDRHRSAVLLTLAMIAAGLVAIVDLGERAARIAATRGSSACSRFRPRRS